MSCRKCKNDEIPCGGCEINNLNDMINLLQAQLALKNNIIDNQKQQIEYLKASIHGFKTAMNITIENCKEYMDSTNCTQCSIQIDTDWAKEHDGLCSHCEYIKFAEKWNLERNDKTLEKYINKK